MPLKITSKVDGYRLCGCEHPRVETEYPDGRFTAEELDLLKAEPILTVEITAPDDAPPPKNPARGKRK